MEINTTLLSIIVFVLAYLTDLVIGDPRWAPHPVRIIGKLISFFEPVLRKISDGVGRERLAGILLAFLVTSSVYCVTLVIEKSIIYGTTGIIRYAGFVFLVLLTATTLATRELVRAGIHIVEALENNNVELARCELGKIVGRDTEKLDKKAILRATMESLSENTSDGIVAPLFYLALGGLPLAMAYKAVNTLDSMVGYKNDRYILFGWASARLDDVLNFIPARLTALLIVVSAGIYFRSRSIMKESFQVMLRDGQKHPSPNSGFPEAAMAGALGIEVGGPSTYNGITLVKAVIGSEKNEDYLPPARAALRIVFYTSLLGFFVTLIALIVTALS